MASMSGYLMCPKCLNVYYANALRPQLDFGKPKDICPNYDCNGKELFAIDELMINAVRTLNSKGYKTQFCCSGHFRKSYSDQHSYIWFKDEQFPKSCPDLWYVDDIHRDIIRSDSSMGSLTARIEALEKWADELPEFTEKEVEDDEDAI